MVGTGDASGGRRGEPQHDRHGSEAKLRAYSANVGPSLLNTQSLAAYDDMTYKKEQGYSKVVAVNNSWGGTGGATYNPADPTANRGQARLRRGDRQRVRGRQRRARSTTRSRHSASSPGSSVSPRSTKPDSVVAFSSKGRPSPAVRHEPRRRDRRQRRPAGQPRPPARPEARPRPLPADADCTRREHQLDQGDRGEHRQPGRGDLPRGRLRPARSEDELLRAGTGNLDGDTARDRRDRPDRAGFRAEARPPADARPR